MNLDPVPFIKEFNWIWITWFNNLRKFLIPEDWREVAATGQPEPAFATNWANYTAVSTFNTAAFYKDPFGVVHLKGLVTHTTGGSSTTIFTLPVGYRPSKDNILTSTATGALARIDIKQAGEVYLVTGDASGYLALDGITFRV